MKLVTLKTRDAGPVIGIDHEGRVERILVAADGADPEKAMAIARRMVATYRACEGISDKTLAGMVDGVSTLPERMIAWQLFVMRARGSARLIIEEARKIIQKEGGKI